MAVDTALVWFRRDLRLHDNPTLDVAAAAERLLPVYCFDPREYGTAEFGGHDSFPFQKTGSHRARFRRESVADLRASLRAQDSDLFVVHENTEVALPTLAAAVDADAVYFQTLPTSEEGALERSVKAQLRAQDVAVHSFWTHTLYHLDDLPMPYTQVDDTFTPFRKQVESASPVREPLPSPPLPSLPALDTDDVGDLDGSFDALPTLASLGLDDPPADGRSVLPFDGGESAAKDRLETYVWTHDCLREYKQTRNGLLGADYSSKFSPWLNEGCLSPRYVKAEVDRYEAERVANDSTYWLRFELAWRDFFQFQFKKHGDRFFARGGIRDRTDIDWREDRAALQRWADGETGIPFVDANMRELDRTGFMSNRGRQNVASFLANNLRVDWRWGAAHFETQLVDYDPASNYGNWAYIAGVGNDSRDRYFNILKQAKQYDSGAEYVKHWIPELADLPADSAHEPWTLSRAEQARYGVTLGVDYPQPMIDLEASYEKLR